MRKGQGQAEMKQLAVASSSGPSDSTITDAYFKNYFVSAVSVKMHTFGFRDSVLPVVIR